MENEARVFGASDDMVWCDYEACPEYGEYIYCYFDTSRNCERYHRYIEDLVRGHEHECGEA